MVLVATSMAMFATNLDFFALNLSIPGMARELDTSTPDMQWVMSGFMLALGSFLCWAMLSVGTQTVVSVDRAGEASGVSLSIVIGMAGLGVALVASLIEVVAGGGTSEGTAIEQILRVLAIGSVVIAIPLAFAGRAKAAR